MASNRISEEIESLNSQGDLTAKLPRDVIHGIMEHLPLCDAARLCILSRKWPEIFASTPYLSFDATFFSSVFKEKSGASSKFSKIINKILFQHEGPIQKFSLCVPDHKVRPDVAQWVSFLSRNGIRELSLENQCKLFLELSSHLFSLVGLEKLELYRCRFKPPPNFRGFKRLLTLKFHKVTFVPGKFEDLIMGCPLLENLCLIDCVGVLEVNINAPKLRRLIVVGPFRSLRVRNAENLVSVSIAVEKYPQVYYKTSLYDLIEALATSCKLGKLSPGGYFCKVLFKELSIPTCLEQVKYLNLSCIHLEDLDDYSSAVSAIRRCPNIETLDISVLESADIVISDLGYGQSTKLPKLRKIHAELKWGWDSELKLIEFLISCSPQLEILSVEVKEGLSRSSKSRVAWKLAQFRNASPNMMSIVYMTGKLDENSAGSEAEVHPVS